MPEILPQLHFQIMQGYRSLLLLLLLPKGCRYGDMQQGSKAEFTVTPILSLSLLPGWTQLTTVSGLMKGLRRQLVRWKGRDTG